MTPISSVLPLITTGVTDDPEFIEVLDSMLEGLVRRHTPEKLYVIQIDNWFDHKWLRFSGIGSIDFPVPALMPGFYAAKEEFYQDRLTLPPFVPNRILSQRGFLRASNRYTEALLTPPHSADRQSSELNLHKHIGESFRSDLLVWYSSNSLANGRASVMAYDFTGEKPEAWLAAFTHNDDWSLLSTKGIDRERIAELIPVHQPFDLVTACIIQTFPAYS